MRKKILLFVILSFVLLVNPFSKALLAQVPQLKQNKFGFSVIAVTGVGWEIQSNYITGQKQRKNFSMPGVEFYYERFYDDYFSYGANYWIFSPPDVELTVPHSVVDSIFPTVVSRPLDDEVYSGKFTITGPGLYFKTYLQPNKRGGLKTHLSVGVNLLAVLLKAERAANADSPEISETEITHSMSSRYINLGADYLYRNGFGLRAALRFLSGFNTQAFEFDTGQKKYSTFYLHNTFMLDLGMFYFF